MQWHLQQITAMAGASEQDDEDDNSDDDGDKGDSSDKGDSDNVPPRPALFHSSTHLPATQPDPLTAQEENAPPTPHPDNLSTYACRDTGTTCRV